MRRLTTKVSFLVACVVLLLALNNINVFADITATPIGDAKYSLTYTINGDGTVTITGCTGDVEGALVLPNTIDGRTVTSIGVSAFSGCNGLIGDLVIPSSVTTIDSHAFAMCTGLTGKLTIPDSVIIIGSNAFECCSGLTGDLIIPDSVTTIKPEAFSGCRGFKGKLVISDNLTAIEYCAFETCDGLTGDLTIPNSVTAIGAGAFANCSGFTGDLVIPNSVTAIGGYSFTGCRGLVGDLIIPNRVTSIGANAFYGCSRFTSLIIPSSVTNMEDNAFDACYDLKRVENNSGQTIILPQYLDNLKWTNEESGERIYSIANGVAVRLSYGAGSFDHWGFLNSGNYFSGGDQGYKIKNDDFQRLISNLSETEKARITRSWNLDKYNTGDLGKEYVQWVGSCYGLSVTSILYNKGIADVIDNLTDYDYLYKYVNNTSDTESLINYYFWQQSLSYVVSDSDEYMELSQEEQLNKMITELDKGNPVLFDFTFTGLKEDNTTDIFSHAVVAYDHRDLTSPKIIESKDGITHSYNHKINIYDNAYGYMYEDSDLYYDDDYNICIPQYDFFSFNNSITDGYGCSNSGQLKRATSDLNIINAIEYSSGKVNVPLSPDLIATLYGTDGFTVTSDSNSVAFGSGNHGTKLLNGKKINTIVTSDLSKNGKSEKSLVFPEGQNRGISTDEPLNVSLTNSDEIYYAVSAGESGGEVMVDKDNGVKATFNQSASFDSEIYYKGILENVNDGLFNLEGTNTKEFEISKHKEGIVVKSDNLKDIKINDANYSSEQHAILITDKDADGKLDVYEDKDNDGVYESELEEGETKYLDKMVKLSDTEYVLNLATKEKYYLSELKKVKADGKGYRISTSKSNSRVASMNTKGLISPKKEGVSVINVTKGGKNYKITVNVYNPQFTAKNFTTNAGEKITPIYNDKQLKTVFTLDNKARNRGIATINPDTGEITALKKGTVKVTATVGTGRYARKVTTKVKIYDPSIYAKKSYVRVGKKIQLKIKNGVKNTTWSISNNSIATIDNKGRVRGVTSGTTTVTAVNNGRTMTKEIIVTP